MAGIIALIWVLDILNIKQLECLDTTYPVNTLAWILIWIVVIPLSVRIKINN
ncbi:MAG TPA: hypothetical protein VFD03_06155 [Clostridia bacterium]|nr:hypothetical protein [Clostridia bacterium]